MVKQGYPKKQIKLKERIIEQQTKRLLTSDPWKLPVPSNAHYGTEEMQFYLAALTLDSISGEHAKRKYWKTSGLNLPDQQTVRVRVEKLCVEEMQSNNNHFGLTSQPLTALKYPNYQKRRLSKTMKQVISKELDNQSKSKRRQLRKSRKLQRQRGVDRPVGNYVAVDEHNDPFYGAVEYPLRNGENMASYLVKDRQKSSTKMFFQYLTMYSFERGIRQVLGFHLVRREKRENEWHREEYGPIVRQLIDDIRQHYPITGVVGDGRYYNGGVIKYLLESQLDFVIRADYTRALRLWAQKEDLLNNLEDGSGKWFDGGISFKPRGMKAMKLKLGVVRRGDELLPVVVPPYCKLSIEQALMLYEERFGIETKYRELERRYGKTTSISPHYRVALFAASVNVFNLLMQYLETVVTSSSNSQDWKVTLLDIADQQRYNLRAIALQVGRSLGSIQ